MPNINSVFNLHSLISNIYNDLMTLCVHCRYHYFKLDCENWVLENREGDLLNMIQ